jgi:hypothetical protein
MGRHLSKTRADGAHFIQKRPAIDPDHPNLQLPKKDEADATKFKADREHAAHALHEDAEHFFQQAFKRTPTLADEVIKAVRRNSPEDYDNLIPVDGPPQRPDILPNEKIQVEYLPLTDRVISAGKYVDAWGVIHDYGETATLTYNPNNQTITDGIGQSLVSYGDEITRLHLPGGNVEIRGDCLDPQEAISLRRQLYEASRFTGHLVTNSEIVKIPVKDQTTRTAPIGYEIGLDETGKTFLIKKEQGANLLQDEEAHLEGIKQVGASLRLAPTETILHLVTFYLYRNIERKTHEPKFDFSIYRFYYLVFVSLQCNL